MLGAGDPERNETQPCSICTESIWYNPAALGCIQGMDMTPKPACRNQDRLLKSGDRGAELARKRR